MQEIITILEKELNLEKVSPEVKEKVFSGLGAIIMERCLATLLIKDEEGVIQRMAEQGDLGGALEYATHNMPYLEDILLATAQEVILEYKSA